MLHEHFQGDILREHWGLALIDHVVIAYNENNERRVVV